MPAPRIAVVVPCYNTSSRCADVIARSAPFADTIVAVDDGSTDDPADCLRASRCRVLHLPVNAGKGAALAAGFRELLKDAGDGSGADYVITIDGDGQHDPADIPRLVERAGRDGADLVLGSRYAPGGGVENWGLTRRMISRGGCRYAQAILRVPVRDLTGGFKCFRREVLEAIDFDSVQARGYAFQVEMTYRAIQAGFRVVEVPIVFRDRQIGQSKISFSIAVEALWLVPSLRWPRLMRRWPANRKPLADPALPPIAAADGVPDDYESGVDTGTPAEALTERSA